VSRLQESHRRINAEIAQEKAAALGLRHHRIVDQQFPEPPRRSR